MPDLPNDLLSRSKSHGERANTYSRRIDDQLGKSSSATRDGTHLGWANTTTQFDDLMSQPISQIVSFGVAALGVGMMFLAFSGGGGRLFAMGMFVALLAAFPCYYIFSNMKRARTINDTLFHHNLAIDAQQEQAANILRANFSQTEIQLAALEANVSVEEMRLAMISAAGMAMREERNANETWAYTQDLRNKDHELSVKDKEILLERAKGEVRVDELRASAESSREKLRVRTELDLRKAKEELYAEQERFVREMSKLDKEHTQAAKLQRINEVTQLRKVLVAAHAELRHNPALADQVTTIISEVDFMLEAMQKKEPLTPEDYQRQELIDQMLTRFLLKRHDLNDDGAAVA